MRKGPRKSWPLALCGVLSALSVAILTLGAVIPLAMFIAPAFAGILVMLAGEECGRKMALTQYVAVSLLSLVLVSDKEEAFAFVFLLGGWPLIQEKFNRIAVRFLRVAAKVFYFALAILAMYSVFYLLFPMEQTAQELLVAERLMAAAALLMGNIAFLLYDRALMNMRRLYLLVWKPKLHSMLGF